MLACKIGKLMENPGKLMIELTQLFPKLISYGGKNYVEFATVGVGIDVNFLHLSGLFFFQANTFPTILGVLLPASTSPSMRMNPGGKFISVTSLSHIPMSANTILDTLSYCLS